MSALSINMIDCFNMVSDIHGYLNVTICFLVKIPGGIESIPPADIIDADKASRAELWHRYCSCEFELMAQADLAYNQYLMKHIA